MFENETPPHHKEGKPHGAERITNPISNTSWRNDEGDEAHPPLGQGLRRGTENGTEKDHTPTRGRNQPGDETTTGKETTTTGGRADVGISLTSPGREHQIVPPRPQNAGIAPSEEVAELGVLSALTGGEPPRTRRRGGTDERRKKVRSRKNRKPKRRGRKQRTLSRYTCSASFRAAFERRLPGLKLHPAYWELLEHLLFAKERGRDRPLLIPHGVLAAMAGEEPSTFRSGDFIRAFQRDVLPGFEWEEYDYSRGLVREVASDGLPDWAVDALRSEVSRSPLDIDDRVYFATGFSFDRKRDPKRLWLADLTEAEEAAADHEMNPDQKAIAGYLHALSRRSFSFLSKHAAGASAVAGAIAKEEARAQAQRLLQRIHTQPIPAYRPVGNSYRLFSVVGGLQQLYKDVRVALMGGCCDLDADALHLAIMAAKWGIPELQRFLDRHGAAAVWRALTAHVAADLHGRDTDVHPLSDAEHKAYKGALKHGVYALGYGGGKAAIARQVEDHDTRALFDDYDEVVESMLRWEVLAAVFAAKERMVAQIIADGGMKGHYGWIKMRKGRTPLTVLSMASSSYELALMKTVFDVADEQGDYCTVLLYQFDGVTVRFRRQADADWVIEKMQAAFDRKAREFGISTSLSADWL